MHRFMSAILLAIAFLSPVHASTPKEELMVPPEGARHYVISSIASKTGDIWSWELPDGRIAYRMSMSLRGWITETDQVVTLDANARPIALAVRGFTDEGDATEDFSVDANGVAHWTTSVDSGSAQLGTRVYNSYGGPWLAQELDVALLIAAGEAGIDLLPGGHASISIGDAVEIEGPNGPVAVKLAFINGYGFAPSPVWLDDQNRFFGNVGIISFLPAGFEAKAAELKQIQDRETANKVREYAHQFLNAENRTPTLVDKVLLFDSVAGEYRPDQAVLISDGKIAAVGAAGTLSAPAGAIVIDGTGKTLLPGLWDAHLHVGDDWNLLQNVATGITNYRSPGTLVDEAHSIYERRATGDLLAPDGKIAAIVDRKNPLAAQGALTVESADETIDAVRQIAAAGLWGVKFYTSMTPEWIAPAAEEAHQLGLHVNGHVPAGMRPLEAVRAGYDEITHINFVMMQAMPQDVVDKSNTAARLEGPAKYGKDVDLDSAEMRAFYREMVEHGTVVDPTLALYETLLTSDGSTMSPSYAPYMDIVPPAVARGWKIGGYPLVEGYTRDDYRKSYVKLLELVGKLHQEGITIVAGTDGYGLELVREIEVYEQAGMSNAQALQSATIVPARLTGMADRAGSIEPGKVANIILVEGNVSQDLANLRRVNTVFLDGYRLDANELRAASGLSGMPK